MAILLDGINRIVKIGAQFGTHGSICQLGVFARNRQDFPQAFD